MAGPEPPDPFETFAQRYAMFRLELQPEEMAWFDHFVERVKSSRRALAHRPQTDFERPILLLMLVEAFRLYAQTRRDLEDAEENLRRTLHVLEAADLVRARRPASGRVGQTRLSRTGSSSPFNAAVLDAFEPSPVQPGRNTILVAVRPYRHRNNASPSSRVQRFPCASRPSP